MASQLPPGANLCDYPAATPPDGVLPNFVDPYSLAPVVTGISVLTYSLAILFTIARLYFYFPKWKLSDYFVITAIVFSGAYMGIVFSLCRYHRHEWNVPACWFDATYMKILYSQGILAGPMFFFSKISVFLLYLSIFSVDRPMQIAIYVGIVFTTCLNWIAIPLESYYSAPHMGDTWDSLLVTQQANHNITYGIVHGALSVVLDVYIFLLPMPIILSLQMTTRKRLQVVGVFLTALMGIVASVVSLVYRIRLRNLQDNTWAQACVYTCVIVETNVAIMVSSMPAASGIMRRHFRESSLYRSFHKSTFSSNDDGSTNRQPYSQNTPNSLLHAHNSRSVKSKFDGRLSSESLRGLQNRRSDLDMEMGEQHCMENMGLAPPGGGGIIRTIQIDQESFNDTAIK